MARNVQNLKIQSNILFYLHFQSKIQNYDVYLGVYQKQQ